MTPVAKLRLFRVAVAAALLSPPAFSLAAEPPKADPSAAVSSAEGTVCSPIDRPPVAPRMIVVRDKETGRLRAATAEEARALLQKESAVRALTSRSGEGLVVRTRPDGSRVADVTGRFESLAVARRVNGTIEQTCTDDPPAAASFLSGQGTNPNPPARPAAAEEK